MFGPTMIENHMRHHYERIYKAKPSPEIVQTRAKRSNPRQTSSRPGSRQLIGNGKLFKTKSTSSQDLRRPLVPHHFPDHFPEFVCQDTITSDHRENASTKISGDYELTLRSTHLPSKMKVPRAEVSNKIDKFFDLVERCERELQEELEARKKRLADGERPRWYRSMSSLSSGRFSCASSPKNSTVQSVSSIASTVKPINRKPLTPTFQRNQRLRSSQSDKFHRNARQARPQSCASRRTTSEMSNVRSVVSSSGPMKAFKKLAPRDYPLPDTDAVTSKLLSDARHYQPPRKKRPSPTPQRKKVVLGSSSSVHSNPSQNGYEGGQNPDENEYEEDFECCDDNDEDGDDEEEEEEEQEEEDMLMTRGWILEQAERGMARQRAKVVDSRFDSHEKASSKDSAYGYSGGESRFATREPTPDAGQGTYKPLGKAKRRSMSARPWRLNKPLGNSGSPRKEVFDSEDERSSGAQLAFINKVTNEIIRRGVFTDKAIREVLETQARQEQQGISRKETAFLISRVQNDLGILSNGGSLQGSKSESSLKELFPLKQRHEVNDMKIYPRVHSSGHSGKNDRQSILCDEDLLTDKEIADILRDIRIEEGVRYRSEENGEEDTDLNDEIKDRLFGSLNISNMNVSFNAKSANESGQKRKDRRREEQELLVKSFAANNTRKKSTGTRFGRDHPRQHLVSSKASRSSSAKGHARQDSSSSNNDMQAIQKTSRDDSESCQGKSKTKILSQLPETPLLSSETPRSSSLYQPETEEDEEQSGVKRQDNDVKESEVVVDSEISDDSNDNPVEAEEIDEEVISSD